MGCFVWGVGREGCGSGSGSNCFLHRTYLVQSFLPIQQHDASEGVCYGSKLKNSNELNKDSVDPGCYVGTL